MQLFGDDVFGPLMRFLLQPSADVRAHVDRFAAEQFDGSPVTRHGVPRTRFTRRAFGCRQVRVWIADAHGARGFERRRAAGLGAAVSSQCARIVASQRSSVRARAPTGSCAFFSLSLSAQDAEENIKADRVPMERAVIFVAADNEVRRGFAAPIWGCVAD